MVNGPSERILRSLDDIEDILETGNRHKRAAATQMNAKSTRAHAVVVVRAARWEDALLEGLSRRERKELLGEQTSLMRVEEVEEVDEPAMDHEDSEGNDNHNGAVLHQPSAKFMKALKTLSKLCLVDLGGSENLQRSKAHEKVKLAGGVVSGEGEVSLQIHKW